MMSPKSLREHGRGTCLWLTFFLRLKHKGNVRFVWGLWHSCLCVYVFVWFCQLCVSSFFGGVNGLATVDSSKNLVVRQDDFSIKWIKATMR